MNVINSYRNTLIPPNTFIGGVGATINTPTLLLNTLSSSGLSLSNITNFQIDGSNNISCNINISYQINNTLPFQGNTSITYFIDLEGKVTYCGNREAFDQCVNLKYLYIPNALAIGFGGAQGSFGNVSSLKAVNVNSGNDIGRSLYTAAKLKTLRFPSMINLSVGNPNYNTLANLTLLRRLNISVTTAINIHYVSNPYFLNIKTGCKVFYSSSLGVANRNAWLNCVWAGASIGDTFLLNGLTYTAGASNNNTGQYDTTGSNQNIRTAALVTAINADTRTGTLGKVLAQSSLTNIGLYVNDVTGASGNSITITNVIGTTLTFPMGNNFVGGNDIHKHLMYLRDTRSCIMIEKTNSTLPSAPTGLSYSNVTGTSVDLNFTAPTPNVNGTDKYEVWIDDGSVFLKLFEYDEISDSGSTLDLTGITISGLKIKIRTIDNQDNLSTFSNEITLP